MWAKVWNILTSLPLIPSFPSGPGGPRGPIIYNKDEINSQIINNMKNINY